MPTKTDREALLAAIIDQPDEDTPRLAYADLLDEDGGEENAARAEFIRLQVALARGTADEDHHARAFTLVRQYGAAWIGMPYTAVPGPGIWKTDPELQRLETVLKLSRGFVEMVRTLPAKFSRLAGRLFASHPIRAAQFYCWSVQDYRKGWLRPALARPEFARLTAIDISCYGMRDSDLADLTRCEHLGRVESLKISGTSYLTGAGLRRIASPALSGLRSLTAHETVALEDNLHESLSGLAHSPHLVGLEDLDLRSPSLGDRGARIVSEAAWKLRRVGLGGSGITSFGATALAFSPQMTGLKELDLRENRLGDEGVIAIASSPVLKHLRVLDLRDTDAGNAGMAALVARPWPLERLILDFKSNVRQRAFADLHRRYGDRLRVDPDVMW